MAQLRELRNEYPAVFALRDQLFAELDKERLDISHAIRMARLNEDTARGIASLWQRHQDKVRPILAHIDHIDRKIADIAAHQGTPLTIIQD